MSISNIIYISIDNLVSHGVVITKLLAKLKSS